MSLFVRKERWYSEPVGGVMAGDWSSSINFEVVLSKARLLIEDILSNRHTARWQDLGREISRMIISTVIFFTRSDVRSQNSIEDDSDLCIEHWMNDHSWGVEMAMRRTLWDTWEIRVAHLKPLWLCSTANSKMIWRSSGGRYKRDLFWPGVVPK